MGALCDAITIDRPGLDSYPPRSISTRNQVWAGAYISQKSRPKFVLLPQAGLRDDSAVAGKREPIDDMIDGPSGCGAGRVLVFTAAGMPTFTRFASSLAILPGLDGQTLYERLLARKASAGASPKS
jgi:hypothetical protein